MPFGVVFVLPLLASIGIFYFVVSPRIRLLGYWVGFTSLLLIGHAFGVPFKEWFMFPFGVP
jgi:hypothetical protein